VVGPIHGQVRRVDARVAAAPLRRTHKRRADPHALKVLVDAEVEDVAHLGGPPAEDYVLDAQAEHAAGRGKRHGLGGGGEGGGGGGGGAGGGGTGGGSGSGGNEDDALVKGVGLYVEPLEVLDVRGEEGLR
jgi:hypothetical protein